MYAVYTFNLQEFKQAMGILRESYYSDKSNVTLNRKSNLKLLSDMSYGGVILKAVVLQTKANNNDFHGNGRKNTFLYRFEWIVRKKVQQICKILLFSCYRFSVNTELNLYKSIRNSTHEYGATHSDDLCYFF